MGPELRFEEEPLRDAAAMRWYYKDDADLEQVSLYGSNVKSMDVSFYECLQIVDFHLVQV